MPSIDRHFVTTARGRIHIARVGSGKPVLLLHQTPRSWNEFRFVLPALGRHYDAIAMDTVGFGDSDPLPFKENSIEAWADCAFALLDTLNLPEIAIVGHHTGASVAMEMAVRQPQRVAALLLSAPPFVDPERRRAKADMPVMDDVPVNADGSHLAALWQMRAPFYPVGATAMLDRFVVDALKAGAMAAEGHRVVYRHRMEDTLPRIACPTRVLAPCADPHAMPHAHRVARAIAGADLVEVEGAMVPFPEQLPEVFSQAVLAFLDQVYPAPR